MLLSGLACDQKEEKVGSTYMKRLDVGQKCFIVWADIKLVR